MKKITFAFLAFSILACGPKEQNAVESSPSGAQDFNAFSDSFIEAYWKINPISASYNGFHEYDGLLPMPSEENRKNKLAFADEWLQKLEQQDIEQLSEHDRIDYQIIKNQLEASKFYISEYKAHEWNPASYNLGGAFFQVVNYQQRPLEDRLKDISEKLAYVPEYYEHATKNLKEVTEVHTQLAIQQLEGSKSMFESKLMDSLDASTLDNIHQMAFTEKIASAVEAINHFINHLKSLETKLSDSSKSFRIGKDLFEKKFHYDIQSSYTAEEIFKQAVEEKQQLHDNLYRLSDDLWDKYYGDQKKPGGRLEQIQMVINAVSKTHVHRDSFLTAIRQQIPELENFVKEKDLLTLDPNKPLVVRETPEYMRGFAGASISAPGPYDKESETYYNVTPLDHYTDEQAESYLREYNHYTLQILNIHEAIPGHYSQLVYSNESPSLIKSIFGNGSMVEGWAVYSELMMLENGYGDDMELGLMYYKWNLRTVCNTILDYGIHVLGFTEEDAMQLLMKEAFQEKSEAEGKWKRARLSQVQLCSYYNGFYEIRDLREELKTVQAEHFDLKQFHEEFLSYGSAPVKFIRTLMLNKQASTEKPA